MNIAIIGMGSIGTRHMRVLQSLRKELAIDTLNGYDLDATPADSWETNPDLVLICTPPATHAGIATAALLETEATVFIEKPHVLELGDGLALERLDQNQRIVVASNMRYNRNMRRLKECVDSSSTKLVSLDFVMSSWLPEWRPYQSLTEQRDVICGIRLDSIHEMDMAYYIAGKIEKSYHLVQTTSIHNEIPDVEDVAKFLLKHHSGTLTSIHLSYSESISPTPRRFVRVVLGRMVEIFTFNPSNQMYVDQMRDVIRHVRNRDGEKIQTLSDANHVLRHTTQDCCS